MRFGVCWRGLLSVAALLPLTAATLWSAEPVDEFLEALRRRRYFDEANEYASRLSSMSGLSDATRQRESYEQGLTLLASAGGESDPKLRDSQLSKAAELFEKFSKSYPNHELAATTNSQLGNILIERGRGSVLAHRTDKSDALLAAARGYFEQAQGRFQTAETALDERVQALPKLVPPEDTELQARKTKAVNDLAQLRLLRASVDYELAKTFAAGSAEAQQRLKVAAEAYGKLYETYRRVPAGLLARLWEGHCYQEMNDLRRALGCYQVLIEQPNSQELRFVKTKGTRHALECWTHDSVKRYLEAIERGERWEKELGAGQSDADAMAIRYLTGLAYQEQLKTLSSKDPNRQKMIGAARQHMTEVADRPGEFQRPAKMLLVALAQNKGKDSAKTTPKAKAKAKASTKSKGKAKESKAQEDGSRFVEAFEQARAALEKMQDATAALKAAEEAKDEAAAKTAQTQKAQATADARKALVTALATSDSKTAAEDLNSARYYLAYLDFDMGRYYDALALGQYLAEHFPESVPGRQGARIALAAAVRLYGEVKEGDKEFETAQIRRVADTIFSKWPEQEEADEAAVTLLGFAATQQQADGVLEYLGKISATSPRRALAELRAGQALWSNYLRASQAPEAERPPVEKLDALRAKSQEVLAQGITRLQEASEVDATLASAVYTLVHMYVTTGQNDKAIEWLENPKVGLLTLVKAKSPAVAREGFASETYKMALRAYIAVDPPRLKEAEAVMDSLEALVKSGNDPKAADNLTAIYIGLGRELQEHLQLLRKSGKRKELDAISKAFETFLDRITEREKAGNYVSLNWVGETYYNLGLAFDAGGPNEFVKAKGYFAKAADAYQKMLAVAEKDPKYRENPDGLLSVRMRLADCYRHGDKFDDAIKTLLTVLRKRPTMLPAQVQAAETHQARGSVDPKGYYLAISGSDPGKDGRNVIWGWSQISRLTSNKPQFGDTFHLARLSMANARLKYAQSLKKDAKESKTILEAAKHDLWMTYKTHPELGGGDKAKQYDALLRQIQSGLGEKESGLTEFKERDAATADADAQAK